MLCLNSTEAERSMLCDERSILINDRYIIGYALPRRAHKMKWSGVYVIYNTISLKFYIGSAVNIRLRFNEHRTYLNKGIHKNKHLQSAWNLYGRGSFEFCLVEETLPDKIALLQAEQRWIDSTKACTSGYNIAIVAGSNLGIKHTEEYANWLRKPVTTLTSAGSVITHYKSIKAAIQKSGLSRAAITSALIRHTLCGSRDLTKGILVVYTKDLSKYEGVSYTRRCKVRGIVQLTLDGSVVYEYVSIRDAFRSTGIDEASIRGCCSNIQRTAGGFMWCYKENAEQKIGTKCVWGKRIGKPIAAYSLVDGSLVERFNEICEVDKKYGYSRDSLYDCLSGRRKTAYGMVWKYTEEAA